MRKPLFGSQFSFQKGSLCTSGFVGGCIQCVVCFVGGVQASRVNRLFTLGVIAIEVGRYSSIKCQRLVPEFFRVVAKQWSLRLAEVLIRSDPATWVESSAARPKGGLRGVKAGVSGHRIK